MRRIKNLFRIPKKKPAVSDRVWILYNQHGHAVIENSYQAAWKRYYRFPNSYKIKPIRYDKVRKTKIS